MPIIHLYPEVRKNSAHRQRFRRPHVGGLAIISAMVVAVMPSPVYAQDVSEKSPGAVVTQATGDGKAKNVILFLADAAGVSAISAASLLGYNEPLKLHIQLWPYLGLSETSPVDAFVSDSANGMSAIMTGVKTRNGVISQSPDAVRGERD
ncbi:MAG: alkaline phosphatase, partial [Sphingorhabdus sp.]